MDATMIFIICTIITVVVSIVVRVVWDWAGNKNGKKEIDQLKKDVHDKITEKFSMVEKVNVNIEKQREEFSELKGLILTSYVKKEEFEKHLARFETVRDKTLSNDNTITMINETVRQNVQRMTQLENS